MPSLSAVDAAGDVVGANEVPGKSRKSDQEIRHAVAAGRATRNPPIGSAPSPTKTKRPVDAVVAGAASGNVRRRAPR